MANSDLDNIMTKHKILVTINEQNRFWVIVDNGKLIRNPTKEDLRGAKPKSYSKTNVCPRCREENEKEGNDLTDKSILYPGNILHDTDKNGNKTDEIVCAVHGKRHYSRYNPNSQMNMVYKPLSKKRMGNLTDPGNLLGEYCEVLTSKWRGIKKLSEEYNRYNLPFDHSKDPELGIVQTKGARLRSFRRGILTYDIWSASLVNEQNKKFDHMILYCISKDEKRVERLYIFPWKDLSAIYGTVTDTWYEQYRIKDKEILQKVNEIWKEIKRDNI